MIKTVLLLIWFTITVGAQQVKVVPPVYEVFDDPDNGDFVITWVSEGSHLAYFIIASQDGVNWTVVLRNLIAEKGVRDGARYDYGYRDFNGKLIIWDDVSRRGWLLKVGSTLRPFSENRKMARTSGKQYKRWKRKENQLNHLQK